MRYLFKYEVHSADFKYDKSGNYYYKPQYTFINNDSINYGGLVLDDYWNVLDEEYNKVGPSEATVRTHERWTSLLRDLMTGLGQSSPYNSVPIEDIQLEDLPQELQEDLRELLEQLGLDAEDSPLAHPDVQLLMRLNYLVQFFKPQFIMKRSFEIVQERDEIGCD